jgi:paraquat-inducible protein A
MDREETFPNRSEDGIALSALRECPICGLFQTVAAPAPRTSQLCRRCSSVLRQHRTDPARRALALVIAALLLFALAATQPFLSLDLGGGSQTTLLGGPEALEQTGLAPLALVVLITTMLAPLARLGMTLRVLLALQWPDLAGAPTRYLAQLFRWAEWLEPWSMLEVFLLGVFVAYAKLIDLAPVHVGIAAYALGAVMLMTAAADATLDRAAIWERLETTSPPNRTHTASRHRIGCECCGRVSTGAQHCPRCGAALEHRRPHALMRSWALLLAAVVLYIPANTLPILTVIQLGQGSPHTILQGVAELTASGLWPLAALVFTASVAVPLLKVVGLAYLLIATQMHSTRHLRGRTLVYRIVEAAGRWSMIDVFMISILTALVQMGALATVIPGPGALCFCAVVILTMLAAHEFDPRLMWDATNWRGA